MNGKKVALGLAKLLAIGGAMGGIIGGVIYWAKKALKSDTDFKNRYKAYYTTTTQWLINRNEKKSVGDYFKENNYKTIAIYGMGTMAEIFYDELKESNPNVKVAYFIDKNADKLYYGLDDIPVVSLDKIEEQEEVEAIIVTPVYDFNKISDDLAELELPTEIISLEDIVYEI